MATLLRRTLLLVMLMGTVILFSLPQPLAAQETITSTTYQLTVNVVAANGEAINSAEITVMDSTNTIINTNPTDNNGNCTFDLLGGSYTVTATADGYTFSAIDVALNAAQGIQFTAQP